MRGLRSTIALLVVLVGLGAYIYFVGSRSEDSSSTQERVFPQLADVPLEQVWGGYVDITRNRAPHWGRLDGNLYFAQGFSGHGVAAAGLAGEVIAAAIAGQSERLDVFQRLRHAPFPGGRLLRTPLLVAAMSWYKLRDALW